MHRFCIISFRIAVKKAVWSAPTDRKRFSLLFGKELSQKLSKVHFYCFLIAKIHEDICVKMRFQLRQTTKGVGVVVGGPNIAFA